MLAFASLSGPLSASASASVFDEVSSYQTAVTLNPDRDWAKEVQAKSSDWLNRARTEKERASILQLQNRTRGLSELKKCLEKNGIPLSGVYRDIAMGSTSSIEAGLQNCGLSRDLVAQMKGLQGLSSEAQVRILIDTALVKKNLDSIRKSIEFVNLTGAGEPQGGASAESIYTKVCGSATGHKLRGAFCDPEMRAARLNEINTIKKSTSKNAMSPEQLATGINSSITRVSRIYEEIPVQAKDHARDAKGGADAYARYARAFAEEAGRPWGAFLIVGKIANQVGTIQTPNGKDLLPMFAHAPVALPLSAQSKAMIKESAKVGAEAFLKIAREENASFEATYGSGDFHLARLLGSNPQIFGEMLTSNPEIAPLVCQAATTYSRDSAVQKSVQDGVRRWAAALGLGTGAAALISCITTAVAPEFAPVSGTACVYTTYLASAANAVSVASDLMTMGDTQGRIDDLMSAWMSGNPGAKPTEVAAARREYAEALSDLAITGLLTAAGAARLPSVLARAIRPSVKGARAFAKIMSEKATVKMFNDIRDAHGASAVDDLLAAIASQPEADAKKIIQQLKALDPYDFRIASTVENVKKSIAACAL